MLMLALAVMVAAPPAIALAAASGPAAAVSDPVAGDGLESAFCRNPQLAAGLSSAASANCATSGSVDAGAPLGNYNFDIATASGFASLSPTSLVDQIVQQVLLEPVWNGLLWLVRAVMVALEWCYSIDLLNPSVMGEVGGALHQAQATLTQPWLVTVFAIAAVLTVYHGLVRRRVAQSVGEAVLVVAMTVAGLWLIADPSGTVGELDRVVNQSSLGTLGAITSGSPTQAEGSFADAMRGLFAGAVQAPWCFMEFGDVDWCRNPGKLDPGLHALGRTLAQELSDSASCPRHPAELTLCSAPGSAMQAREAQAATLLRRASTNGDLFLALPSSAPGRSSLSDDQSLVHRLCGGSDVDSCQGATGAQAAFQGPAGTWARVSGLVLIGGGLIGMVAMLGFIALRLLGAAIGTLFYLLLAPVAVLAPGLGEVGRGAFRSWCVRLLGAVVAKLLYTVFLGAVLLTVSVLGSMGSLGWWTQWLLIAAFWWCVFQNRHRVFELATLGHRDTGMRSLRTARGFVEDPVGRTSRLAGRATRTALGVSRFRPAGGFVERWARFPSRPDQGIATRGGSDSAGRADGGEAPLRSAPGLDELRAGQVAISLERDGSDARATVVREGAIEAEIAALRRRQASLIRNQCVAQERGDRRAALRARVRADALGRRADEQLGRLAWARRELVKEEDSYAASGLVHTVEQRTRRGELLDRAAGQRCGERQDWRSAAARGATGRASRGGARAGVGGDHRDYAALAALGGHTPDQYGRMSPAERLRVRAAVDRALRQRSRGPAPLEDGIAAVGSSAGALSPERDAGRAASEGLLESVASRHSRGAVGAAAAGGRGADLRPSMRRELAAEIMARERQFAREYYERQRRRAEAGIDTAKEVSTGDEPGARGDQDEKALGSRAASPSHEERRETS